MLAGVGPFAIENGLVPPVGDVTPVRIHMVNTDEPRGGARRRRRAAPSRYDGDARIDGVPGHAAPIPHRVPRRRRLDLRRAAAHRQRRRRRRGRRRVTCIDNGMPVVCLRAADLGMTGDETPGRARGRRRRSRRGSRRSGSPPGRCMNLGDVTEQDRAEDVPAVAARRHGGAVCTRTFIPHRVHEAIGVLGAVSRRDRLPAAGLGRRTSVAVRRRPATALPTSRSSTRPASSPSSLDVDDVDGARS